MINFHQFFSNKTKLWKLLTIASIVLFLFILFFSIYFLLLKNKKPESTISNLKENNNINNEEMKNKNNKCSGCERRKIDGIFVNSSEINPPLVAIMIDNHLDARPAHGIDQASLVYEAEVEGHFTRYMAIFPNGGETAQIGPVRSARPYFVDWAEDLEAVYAHCGGSPEALVEIIQKDIIDLNEFYNGQYFWREKERLAPYNIIISAENISKFIKKNEITEPSFSPWKFKEDSPISSSTNQIIKIEYSHPDFKVSWRYNDVDNDYIRDLAGRLQLTADKRIISAKNIVIQKIPAYVLDEKLRLEMETIGDGEAIICLDGECKEGKWKKEKDKVRTKFYYLDNDQEVEFNAGQTWIEITRPEVEIVY